MNANRRQFNLGLTTYSAFAPIQSVGTKFRAICPSGGMKP
jgi:hypothetical protein